MKKSILMILAALAILTVLVTGVFAAEPEVKPLPSQNNNSWQQMYNYCNSMMGQFGYNGMMGGYAPNFNAPNFNNNN